MTNKILTTVCALCLSAVQPLMAQEAGDVITGQVNDEFGPVMMANVVEIDASNRIVVAKTTDMNGNFSFQLKNPKDRIRISYVGYKTQTLPIKSTSYNIMLKSETMLDNVEIKGGRKAQGSGLAIPVKEISTARQTISTKEFEGLAITTIDEALQGRIAGLDIVANSGNLGSGTSMRLRGVSSINGNSEPLVVVDGNVWQTGDDFDFGSANDEKFAELLNINPEDIESISVLKDAAATAIWGSQGANGVIEIKTKRGARGKTKVTYSYRVTATYQPEGMKLLNGDQYTMLLKEEYFNPNFSDANSNFPEINYRPWQEFSEAEMYNNNTDWVDAVKQTGWRQNHYVAISGGGEKANFRISAGYDHETGSIIEQKLDRFTTRVGLDYFISNRIKAVTNVAFTYTNNQKNYQDLLGNAYVRMPNLSIYEQDHYGNNLSNFYNILPSVSPQLQDQAGRYNPVALAYLATNDERSYNIEPEFKLNYELMGVSEDKTRLSYEGKIVFNIFNRYNDMYLPLELTSKGWNSSKDKDANRATNDAHKSLGITTTHTLTFVPHFRNLDHALMMMGRAQVTSGNNTTQSTSEWGLPSGTIVSTGAPGIIDSFGSSHGQWRSVYFTYSMHYAYKGRYIFDFSLRHDGNTKFGPDERWGTFPAFSGKWIISDEPWMKWSSKILSMLAVRPGWGIVGTPPAAEGLYFSKYGGGGSGYMGNASTYQKNLQLKKLKWEEKETVNLGIDFGFLNGKIDGNVEIYSQKTRDLLMANRAIPSSSGYATLPYQNVGVMKNTGWEFNINGNGIVKLGKFSVDVNVTFANNKNSIVEMDETCLKSLNHDFDRSNGSYLTRVEIDRPFGAIYGFRYKGVYQYSEYSTKEVKGVSGPNAPVARDAFGRVIIDNKGRTTPMMFCYGTTAEYEFKGGDAIYEDVNHDGQINELDIVYLGSSLPKVTGGWGIKFRYGSWMLNSQFNFRVGNKIINKARMLAENMWENNNQSRAVNWRWRVEGDITEIPRALYKRGYNWLGSDRFVEDGSFMRLNYTQLSYSVPQKILKRWGLSQLSLYISANNLFCLTKYSGADPEVGYGGYGVVYDMAKTPRSRSFTGGLTIGF